MPYAQIDVAAPHHPKVFALSDAAFRLWVVSLCYAQQHLTDGLIEARILPLLLPQRPRPTVVATELVKANLWDAHPDGWLIHDYTTWNRTRDEVEKRRAKWRAKREGRPPRSTETPPSGTTERTQGTPPECTEGCTRHTHTHTSTHTKKDQVQEGGETPSDTTEARIWAAWLAAAATARHSVPLTASNTDWHHLVALRAQPISRLEAAMTCWWQSPHVDRRILGMFRSDYTDVCAHLDRGGTPDTFRAPKPRLSPAPQRAAERTAANVAVLSAFARGDR